MSEQKFSRNRPITTDTEKKILVVALCLPAVAFLAALILLLQSCAVWVRLLLLAIQAGVAIPAALFLSKK